MRVYDIIIAGGVWWQLDDPRSPGHAVAIPAGTVFRIREGGTDSNSFVTGHIENGQWLVDEGKAAGSYPSANRAVRAVHGGTSLDAWLYVVVRWDGGWIDADDLRRLPGTALDAIKDLSRMRFGMAEARKLKGAKTAPAHVLLRAAATIAKQIEED